MGGRFSIAFVPTQGKAWILDLGADDVNDRESAKSKSLIVVCEGGENQVTVVWRSWGLDKCEIVSIRCERIYFLSSLFRFFDHHRTSFPILRRSIDLQ